MKMEELNISLVVGAIVVGGLVGLYLYGRRIKKGNKDNSSEGIIKVSGNDYSDLVDNMKDKGLKNKVTFEFVPLFSYENLAKWINEADIKDAEDNYEVYGCLLVRTIKEVDKFNIDLRELSEEQKNHILGAMIINTQNNEIIHQRWIVADDIDGDLKDSFGDNNVIILK